MKQLTGLDASFLYMETPTTFGHVNGLSIYQRPPGDFDPFEVTYERFGNMVSKVEPMRRKLAEVPFNLDHPYWVIDDEFDLDFHVRHIAIPPPGAADQLAEQVARIIARPMDRRRPLWEVYVIEGLGDGRWALLTKYHHATIDGASGVILLNMLTDKDPSAPPMEPGPAWEGEPMPSDAELLRITAKHLASNPVKNLRLQLKLVRALAEGVGAYGVSAAAEQARSFVKAIANRGTPDRPDNERKVSLPITPAPPTPWNRTISQHRRFAMRSASLEDIKALKDATGGTVNDIVMAICAGALREYLIRHNALPDKPLRAMVPVSIRTGNEEDPWTNRVSSIVADLPTDCADPLERVARCREAMAVAKRQFELVPAEALVDATQFTSPVVAASAMRLASRLRLADRVNLPTNVTISNVPGPRHPVYFSGARMDNYIPVSIVTDGMGLNITVHSYRDRLDFGLVACRELVPDLWDMVDLHIDEIDRLFEATGAQRVEPVHEASPRRGAPGHRHEGEAAAALAAAPGAAKAPAPSPAKRTTSTKAAAKKAPAKRAPAKKTAAKKTAAKKAAS